MKALASGRGPIYQATCEYLDWRLAGRQGEKPGYARTVRDDFRAGVSINGNATPDDPDVISSSPGGLMLMVWGRPPRYPANPMLVLGLAFDLDDKTVHQLRTPIAKALEDKGIPFLPVAWGAIGEASARSANGWGSVKLIERVGMNCVFRGFGSHYISGFDANEKPPLYFLAELPCAVSTHAEGIEALKPRSVKLAEAQGIEVLRQGDMFAIPTKLHKHDLACMGAKFDTELKEEIQQREFVGQWNIIVTNRHGDVIRPSTTTISRRRGLYGTAHTASELAYLPDGTMFARGSLIHDPRGVLMESRAADHAELKLPGRFWYLIARNTVPVIARAQERR